MLKLPKFDYFFLLLLIISCSKKPEKDKVEVTKQNIQVTDSIAKSPVYNFNKNFVLGKFDYKKDSLFVKVDAKHSSKTLFLQKETYEAFKKMHYKAKQDGIDLIIISGTRNYYEQKYIWERKWKKYSDLKPIERAKKILEYSSMPSSSRHHWGTDIDLNNLNNSYFKKGKGKKEYEWLHNNANDFGFYQVYTNKKNGRKGYNEEKWHWTYLPLSKKYLTFFNAKINNEDINGFNGATLASELNIINDYVNGVSVKIK